MLIELKIWVYTPLLAKVSLHKKLNCTNTTTYEQNSCTKLAGEKQQISFAEVVELCTISIQMTSQLKLPHSQCRNLRHLAGSK